MMATLDRQTYKSSWNPNTAEMVIKITDGDGFSAAGVYTASVTIPAGAYLNDVQVHGVTLWDSASSASMIVGDEDDDNGFYEATNLLSGGALAAGEVFAFNHDGGEKGAYVTDDDGALGGYSSSTRTVTAKITTGGAGTAGETRFLVIWSKPTDSVSGSYVAS